MSGHQKRNENTMTGLVGMWIQLIPLLPLLSEAAKAELAAPGYGAESVMFRHLSSLMDNGIVTKS